MKKKKKRDKFQQYLLAPDNPVQRPAAKELVKYNAISNALAIAIVNHCTQINCPICPRLIREIKHFEEMKE